jgi:hypothetical protein
VKRSPAVHCHELLAEGPLSNVTTCSCGSVHLTIGALTLRLEPGAAESLWITLGEGLSILHARATEPTPRPRVSDEPS